MNRYFNEEIAGRLARSGVMAVLVIQNPDRAVDTARALLAGGVDTMELALRTDRSLEALERIAREVPEMTAGAGTILRPEQVVRARDAGAAFGVSPGFSDAALEKALDLKFPFAPGILTPSELERALSYGCRTVKLFPAQAAGGPAYAKAIHAPYKHLGIQFIPLGGLSAANMGDYLKLDFIPAVGGSWIAPGAAIESGEWAAIEKNAAEAVALAKAARP